MVINVYAAIANGVWLYDPKQHRLEQRLDADIRSQTGTEHFVGSAPLNLVYVVADGERICRTSRRKSAAITPCYN
jgi:hypothetical protein